MSLSLVVLTYGLGKHFWNVPLHDFYPYFNLYNVLAAILFCAATGLAKGAILLFYLRIFPSRTTRIVVWCLFAYTLSYSLASVLVNIFSCSPVNGSWDLEAAATAKCIDRPVFYFAQAGLGIFADFATVILPLPVLRELRLPLRQKVGVGILLVMGAL
jgi:hypothetical protein